MTDKTMPPAEQMPPPDAGMGMSPDAMSPDSEMPQDDQVMLMIPKPEFDRANAMLTDLTALFNQLSSGLNEQQASMRGEMPEAMLPSEGEPDMDAFLQSIAEEGNVRK